MSTLPSNDSNTQPSTPVKVKPASVNDILSTIQNLNTSAGFDVFLPSLQKPVKFKLLSTKQLKRILETVVDSPVYNTQFTLVANSIFKENCLDNSVDVDSLNIYDKVIFLLKTRIESVSKDYTAKFTQEEIEQFGLKDENITIDLSEIYQSFLDKNITYNDQHLSHDSCTCTCSLPTLKTENTIEAELHKNLKIEIETPEELRTIIGDTFINEVTKYVKTLTLNENEINLFNYTFKDRIKIVESLPVPLINKVLKYVEEYRSQIEPLITFTVSVQDTDNEIKYIKKDIPFDATIFSV